jgi:predicted ester cyclase
MSIEQHKAVVQQLRDVWDEGSYEILDEIIAPDYVAHLPFGDVTGRDAYRAAIEAMRAGLPNLNSGVEAVIAEGDRVVTRGVMTGTHQGELMGAPPTGNRVCFTWTNTYRLEGNKIVEQWGNHDDLGLMRQLGLLPS